MEKIIQIIILAIIFSGIFAFITMMVVRIVFLFLGTIKKTKKLATILSLLSCIIPICLVVMNDSPSNDDEEVFNLCSWISIVGAPLIFNILIRISSLWREFIYVEKVIVCPHCGAWNEYEKLKCHSHSEHSGWRIVDRDIKDSYGNRVGSYESREQCTYSYYDYTLRCTKCGEEFEHTFSY